jgi:hypothetical protein
MIVTIVGCGASAIDWIPRGHSVGVNDSWKWGKPTDSLLVCNRPTNFNQQRLSVITNSKPSTFYSHKGNWEYAFPNWSKVRLIPWYGSLYKGNCYSSNTSPFIALSLAWNLGATEIVMWGVDMLNHHIFNESNPETEREIKAYMELIGVLNEQGVRVCLGARGTAFDDKLDLWD